MADIGTARLKVIPSFGPRGTLTHSVTKALGGVNIAPVGTKIGTNFGTSMNRGFSRAFTSGAIMSAVSAATSKALSVIASSASAAAGRLDTLKNYPIVMQSLGYSSKDAQASIKLMSDRLQTLPTRLDYMAGVVKGIAATTGDLDQATKAGLALNDMLLASGSNQQLVTAATEQFRQMLAKGKPDMQDWKSLMQTAPAQLKQLAEEMLGAGATTEQLFLAIGGGSEKARKNMTVTQKSMGDLLNALIKLDQEGGRGIASFKDQAKVATQGVTTSFDNLKNAVVRGLTDMMDSFGRHNIVSIIETIRGGVLKFSKIIASTISSMLPTFQRFGGAISSAFSKLSANAFGAFAGALTILKGALTVFGPTLEGVIQILPTAVTAFLSFRSAQTALSGFAGFLGGFGEKIFSLAGFFEKLGDTGSAGHCLKLAAGASHLAGVISSPLFLGIGGIVAGVVGSFIFQFLEAEKKTQDFKDSLGSLSDATARAVSLGKAGEGVTIFGETAKKTALSIEDLTTKVNNHAKTISDISGRAEAQIVPLTNAQSILNEYAGKSDLSKDAQGRLAWAIDQVNKQFGLHIEEADVLNNKYTDNEGRVQNLTEKINELIEAKKNEIQVNAMAEILTEAYKHQYEVQQNLIAAEDEHNKKREEYIQKAMERDGVDRKLAENMTNINMINDETTKKLNEAKSAYDGSTQSVIKLEKQLSDLQKGAKETKDAIDVWMAGQGGVIASGLSRQGQDLNQFKENLRHVGVTTENLQKLSADQLIRLVKTYDGTSDSVREALRSMGIKIGEYNDLHIKNHEGTITVNRISLEDAEKNVYTWNGSKLVDQNGKAVVDGQSLRDEQGHLYTWNGSHLETQSSKAEIESNIEHYLEKLKEWNKLPFSRKRAILEVTVRKNYEGGHVPEHAAGGFFSSSDGFIATGPTLTTHGLVGEAGAEAIFSHAGASHIVPLTNRRYAKPFIDQIVDGLDKRQKSDPMQATRAIISWLSTELPRIIAEYTPTVGRRDLRREVGYV